eukprot:7525656-Ditylum_brightwellii.AAC.1
MACYGIETIPNYTLHDNGNNEMVPTIKPIDQHIMNALTAIYITSWVKYNDQNTKLQISLKIQEETCQAKKGNNVHEILATETSANRATLQKRIELETDNRTK